MSTIRGKAIRDPFFNQCTDDSQYWIYKCGTKRKITGRGWTNLTTHVLKEHAQEYAALKHAHETAESSTGTQSQFQFYTKKTKNLRLIEVHINLQSAFPCL